MKVVNNSIKKNKLFNNINLYTEINNDIKELSISNNKINKEIKDSSKLYNYVTELNINNNHLNNLILGIIYPSIYISNTMYLSISTSNSLSLYLYLYPSIFFYISRIQSIE
jgi:hypothetical protein